MGASIKIYNNIIYETKYIIKERIPNDRLANGKYQNRKATKTSEKARISYRNVLHAY